MVKAKNVCDDSWTYAPVLERMVEIMGSREQGVSFGEAMRRAMVELRIPVPPHMEEDLLVEAFRIIAAGRIPGAPDA